MAWKIVRAQETGAYPEHNISAHLLIEVKIDGYRIVKCGLPVHWTKKELQDYVVANEAYWLEQAKERVAGKPDSAGILPRNDLLEDVDIPINIEAEIDAIKGRLDVLDSWINRR